MKDSLFIKICLIIIIVLLGLNFFFSHSNSDRYSMYVDTRYNGIIKLDKQTGQIWAISLGENCTGCIVELGKTLGEFTPKNFFDILKDSTP